MRAVRGELMLLLAVIMNSLGVVLLLYSGSGISAISSVPFFPQPDNAGAVSGYLDIHFPGLPDSGPVCLPEENCPVIFSVIHRRIFLRSLHGPPYSMGL